MSFEQRAQEAIKAEGGRMTAQRQLVIDLLAHSSQQIDAESLYALAYQQDTSISLATVYRTLNALADADILQRRYISPEHNRQYFERVPDGSTFFFTCRVCHKTRPFATQAVEHLRQELERAYRWESINICMCVDGICDECRVDGAPAQEGNCS